MLVDRSRHRYDVYVGGFEVFGARGIAQLGCLLQFLAAHFQCVILAVLKLGDTLQINVKADDGALFAEFNSQRKAYIAKADNCEGEVVYLHCG